MFCLRSWIPILFFLTNASPIYLVLFISATYVLNRPCVYCSLLLAILVISLFDFHTDDWFEPRYRTIDSLNFFSSSHSNQTSCASPASATGPAINGSILIPEPIKDALALLSATANATFNATSEKILSNGKDIVHGLGLNNGTVSGLAAWARGLLRREWRIDCLDVVIRL